MKTLVTKMQEYSNIGSWAIWESERSDGHFTREKDMIENLDFRHYESDLQPSNYVILAMNPGGQYSEKQALSASRKGDNSTRPWNNFHNIGRSKDYRLAEAINFSSLRGSYMTDFFPIVGSKSEVISHFVKKKENEKVVHHLVKELDEELDILLPNEPRVKLVCLGRDVEKWVQTYLIKPRTKVNQLKKEYESLYLPHYSGSNRKVIELSKEWNISTDDAYVKWVVELLKENGIY